MNDLKTMNEVFSGHQDKLRIIKEGDVVKGRILSAGKNEIYVDIDGVGLGVVRGRELYDDEHVLSSLKIGDEVVGSVMELENKEGNIELSFRKAGQERVWGALREQLESKEVITSKILEANKGGLMVKINNVDGFLPVSQLAPEHYPRVEDGDKNKILAVLRGYVGQDFNVRIITAQQEGDKLIVSERAVIEPKLMEKIKKISIGDVVEGTVTGVVDFGAFIKFSVPPGSASDSAGQSGAGEELEGLVHISELAWQRIDDPKDIVKVGDKVKAQVIAIDNDRVSLSMKRLQKDPWEDAVKKYKVGQVVKGKISKIAPFGAFVELDADIHGLAHLGELSDEKIADPSAVLKEGEEREFKIISIEPAEHRLGLSIKALTEKKESSESPPDIQEDKEPKAEEKPAEKDEKKPAEEERAAKQTT